MPIRVTRSVIPSLFTAMNLFSGFVAIVKTTEGAYQTAAWFIVLAVVFDGLDGLMARLTKTSSEFGVELDSLSDVVSFGVAPSFMLYSAFFHEWQSVGMVLAALPAICGALRLARFNVQLTGFDKEYFLGLPIPAAALVTISYLVFYHLPETSYLDPTAKPAAITAVTTLTSLLMVSMIRYETFPKPSPATFRAHPVKLSVALVAVAIAVVTGGEAIFPLMLLYLAYGLLRALLTLVRPSEEFDEATMEEPEATPFDI